MTASASDQSIEPLTELLADRAECLRRLNRDRYEKPTLAEELPVSQSTVDRTLRDLDAAGLVNQTNGRYYITFYGRTALAVYDTFLDNLECVARAQPLLAHLAPDTEFNIGMLIDAELHLNEESTKQPPATRVQDLLEAATIIKGFAYTQIDSATLDVVHEQVLVENTTCEIVFRRALYESLVDSAPEAVNELTSANRFTAYVVNELPFGLLLCKSEAGWQVCVIVYGPEQTLEGIIVNTDSRVVTWAKQLFDKYRMEASPLI